MNLSERRILRACCWALSLSLAGCAGSSGTKGEQGPQGVPGTPGAPGIQGVQGVQGVAGPSSIVAVGYASFNYQRDHGFTPIALPSDGSLGPVFTLGSGAHSGPIDVTADSRVVATATAYLNNGDTNPRSFSCQMTLNPDAGTPIALGFPTYDSIAVFDNKTLSITAATDLVDAGGVYDLSLACSTGLANAGGQVFYGDLVLTAYRLGD